MGSLQSLMGMLPAIGAFSGLQKAADKVDEKQINRVEAIINSMTGYERNHHEPSTAAAASASPAAPAPACRKSTICFGNMRR